MFDSNSCSLHCGRLQGVAQGTFAANKEYLLELFSSVQYFEETQELRICGARNLADDPEQLITTFNRICEMLEKEGKGSLLLKCEDTAEVCFMRYKRWKLQGVQMPDDPFEGVYYLD